MKITKFSHCCLLIEEEGARILTDPGYYAADHSNIRNIDHFDYMKTISPWEQKIYTHIFFGKDHEKHLVPVKKMLRRFEKWGKWKGLAVNYVWEEIWWKRRHEHIPWMEKEIRT